jgi:PAS domain S-box-containing protein
MSLPDSKLHSSPSRTDGTEKDSPSWISSRRLAVGYGLAILAVVAGSLWFYHSQRQYLGRRAEIDLDSIARMKVDGIVTWRKDRLADASMLVQSALIREAMMKWLAGGDPQGSQPLLDEFRTLQSTYAYSDVRLADSSGKVRLSLCGRNDALAPEVARAVADAGRERKPVLTDFYAAAGEPPHLDVVAPLLAGGSPVGALILQNDASQVLFPLIQSWPMPRQSTEALLVRREGDQVLFLNQVRQQTNTAIRLRFSLTQTNQPTVMAVRGQTGAVKGIDYRGVAVLAARVPVPDSRWFLVAKVDAAEALAVWRFRGSMILVLMSVVLLFVSSAVVILWQRNEKAHYRARYEAEAARLRLQERHRITLRSIGDAVIVTDAVGRVELLNPVAETLTGWKDAEAQGQPIEKVFAIINEEARQPAENPVHNVMRQGLIVGLANHTLLIARDGTERPIADSGAPIRDATGQITGVVLVFRDQTAEHKLERTLREGERLLHTVIDLVPHFIFVKDRNSRHLLVNRACAAANGLTPEQMAGRCDLDFVPNRAEAEAFMRDDLEVIDRGQPKFIAEEHLTDAAGRKRILQTTKIPFKMPDGESALVGVAVDITDLIRAEEALRISEERLRLAAEAAQMGTWDRDIPSNRLHWSTEQERLMGYAPGTFPGTNEAFLELLHPDSRAAHHQAQARAREQSGILRAELHFICRDGRERWGLVRGRTFFGPDGRPERIIGIDVDITDRKRAESRTAALAALGLGLSTVQERAQAARVIADATNVLFSCDAFFLDLYDRQTDTLIQLLNLDTINGQQIPVERALEDNRPTPLLRRIMRQGGELVEREATTAAAPGTFGDLGRPSLSMMFVPVRHQGASIGVLSVQSYRRHAYTALDLEVLQGVADHGAGALVRVQAEIALRQSEERLRLAQDAAMAGSWEWNLRTNENVWSDELWKLYGLAPNSQPASYDCWRECIHPQDRDQVERSVQEAARTGGDINIEWRVPDPVAGERWLLSRGQPFRNAQGTVERYVGIVLDITARKRDEEELRRLHAELQRHAANLDRRVRERTAELEAANGELESFSYSVSHDLRAPLRAIDGFASILAREHQQQLDEDGRRALRIISSEAQRMGQLIDDLLVFSRMNRQPVRQTEIDLTELVRAAFAQCAAREPDRQIELDLSPLPPVWGDPVLLRQALENLISNAVKYTRTRPQARIQVQGERNDAECLFTIQDNGVGFDMRYVGKLFGVFQRLHTEDEFEGTGVGLAIVQRVIHRHGGRIWAEGRPDEGATFYFTLPGSKADS